MGRHGRLYSKMKAKPRDYRYGVYEAGPVPVLIRTTDNEKQATDWTKDLNASSRQKVKKIKKKKGEKIKRKKAKKIPIKRYFVYDFDEKRNIYP